MALLKPLTAIAAQIARLQPGDVLLNPRINIGDAGPDLPLISNQITMDRSWHRVTAPAGAASIRELRTINGGLPGDFLVIQRSATSATLVIDDGGGNIRCAGNLSMDNFNDIILLFYDGSVWVELCRSNNN